MAAIAPKMQRAYHSLNQQVVYLHGAVIQAKGNLLWAAQQMAQQAKKKG